MFLELACLAHPGHASGLPRTPISRAAFLEAHLLTPMAPRRGLKLAPHLMGLASPLHLSQHRLIQGSTGATPPRKGCFAFPTSHLGDRNGPLSAHSPSFWPHSVLWCSEHGLEPDCWLWMSPPALTVNLRGHSEQLCPSFLLCTGSEKSNYFPGL